MAGIACGFTHSGRRKSRESYEKESVCQTLVKMFDYIDTDLDGLIKTDVFVAYLSKCDIQLSPDDMKAMKECCNEDGLITKTALQHFVVNSSIYKTFYAKSYLLSSEVNKKQLLFNTMDTNKDGLISKGEFGKTMKSLSRTQVDQVYDKYDRNKDEKLSQKEFGDMMILGVIKKHHEKKNPKIIIS